MRHTQHRESLHLQQQQQVLLLLLLLLRFLVVFVIVIVAGDHLALGRVRIRAGGLFGVGIHLQRTVVGVLLQPRGGRLIVLATVLVELASGDQRLLGLGPRSKTPAARVGLTLHDNALDLSHHTVVTGGHHSVVHLRNGNGDGLALGGDEHDLLVHFDAGLVAKQTGNHELGTKADCVDGAVLDYDALVTGEKGLERADHTTQVGLVTVVIQLPLSIQHVVHGHHVVLLGETTGAHTTQLLHETLSADQQTQMLAKSTNVGTGFTGHPEESQVVVLVHLQQFALVDGTHTKATLHCTLLGRTLKESTAQCVNSIL
mmetsp:Transcript_1879/g.5867  ORF Transcript_1879/g.5867 Transcript_1879/m.5867 type:complete len:315 (+) Transcript_1879:860-1804(+)